MRLPAVRGRVLGAAVLGWVGGVLALTLVPSPPTGSEALSPLCVACGSRGVADLLLNVALFAPVGWGLARGRGWRAAVLAGVGLSLGIELAQVLVPGRFPTLGDVIANGAGAGLGALVVGREARVLPVVASSAALAAVVAPLLLAPSPPEGVYYGQWTARFGTMAHYEGRLLRASVDGIATPSRRSERSGALRDALARDGPVDLTFVAGPPPPSPAPVFSVYDERRRRIFLLAVDGRDVVVHRWTVATTLKLDTPALRWPEAMDGVAVGDTVRMRFARGVDAPCLDVNGRTECDTAIGADAGWTLLISPDGLARGHHRVAGSLWMIALGVMMGVAPWPAGARVLLTGAVAVLALALPGTLPYLSTSVLPPLAVAAGAGAGILLRRKAISP